MKNYSTYTFTFKNKEDEEKFMSRNVSVKRKTTREEDIAMIKDWINIFNS